MGFSPQSGLENSNRCGDLDPFILFHVASTIEVTENQLATTLCKRGGLLGLSGVSGDVRDLQAAADSGDPGARRALNLFIYQLKKSIGAFAAAMGGFDVLVFTGGIGENAWRVRREVCRGLEFLGVTLDDQRNEQTAGRDRLISTSATGVKVLVVATNEELIVARLAKQVLTTVAASAAIA